MAQNPNPYAKKHLIFDPPKIRTKSAHTKSKKGHFWDPLFFSIWFGVLEPKTGLFLTCRRTRNFAPPRPPPFLATFGSRRPGPSESPSSPTIPSLPRPLPPTPSVGSARSAARPASQTMPVLASPRRMYKKSALHLAVMDFLLERQRFCAKKCRSRTSCDYVQIP